MHVVLQKLVPQHAVSRIIGKLASMQRCSWLRHQIIKRYIEHYQVDMSQAIEPDYHQYASFNDFFTRALKPELRPVAADSNAIISPVDGSISEIGKIDFDRILQAKGQFYNLQKLLGGDEHLARRFVHGNFATIYLSPRDYHRIHMPYPGKLVEMIYVPGKLFSVNPYTVDNVPSLFARNERVVCLFETDIGLMAVIAIGAIIVGSVTTQWHGVVMPSSASTIQRTPYSPDQHQFQRGDEMGRFQLGSTVVVLFEPNKMSWQQHLRANDELQFGQLIGRVQ